MNSIIDHLERWTEIQPDKLLSAFLDIKGNEREAYTYRTFNQRTRHLAEHLVQHEGLKPGDRALLLYPPGLDVIVAFFACARAGVIPVPVRPIPSLRNTEALAKLNFVARDCQASTVLTTAASVEAGLQLAGNRNDALGRHVCELLSLNWVATDGIRGVASGGFVDNPCATLFLQYTSGSTSEPRAVIVSHENIIHNASQIIDHMPVCVSWLPQFHDMGLIGYYLFPMVTGGTVYGFSAADFLRRPILWLETISRMRATCSSAPNFGFAYCLREDKLPSGELDSLDLNSLRVLMNASEPVNAETYLRFLDRFAPFGLRAEAHVTAYGLAENTLAATQSGRRIVHVNKQVFQNGVSRLEPRQKQKRNQLSLVSCGRPVDGVALKIVDPETRKELGQRQIGEIWLSGRSVCSGYWNRPELTREVFAAKLAEEPQDQTSYLRTGDLGFLDEEEVFVCGRLKDVIIIRGVNYYPHDIEQTVEAASPKILRGGAVAFRGDGAEETLVVLAEVKSREDLPDGAEIARAIRMNCYVAAATIAFVPPKTVLRTSSGKTARGLTRQRWLNGEVCAIATYSGATDHHSRPSALSFQARFQELLEAFDIRGDEESTLADIGLDSLGLVTLIQDLEHLLAEYGCRHLIADVDAHLIQGLTVKELVSIVTSLESSSDNPLAWLPNSLEQIKQEHVRKERERMGSDAHWDPIVSVEPPADANRMTDVLLTGPTGFFGPFLLSSLLTRTPYIYHALVRATDPIHGMTRISTSLRRAKLWTPGLEEQLRKRVRVVCGDIAQPNLGLDPAQWTSLAREVQAVLHNAALVNYVLNYESLRGSNVEGTRELLHFAHAATRKEFHFISSTIVFGWMTEGLFDEQNNNDSMSSLDFGYSQSKWVAERLVLGAERQGLRVRIYRPAFISASTRGVGSSDDIAILLLAFMIKYGIAVKALNQISFLPADIVAENIASIFASSYAGGRTFHVTADHYYNMMDVTNVISRNYGYEFRYLAIPDFVQEVKRLCTRADRLFPLLDFIDQSWVKIAATQSKRYGNQQYRAARDAAQGAAYGEPDLAEIVDYLIKYMVRDKLIRPPSVTARTFAGSVKVRA